MERCRVPAVHQNRPQNRNLRRCKKASAGSNIFLDGFLSRSRASMSEVGRCLSMWRQAYGKCNWPSPIRMQRLMKMSLAAEAWGEKTCWALNGRPQLSVLTFEKEWATQATGLFCIFQEKERKVGKTFTCTAGRNSQQANRHVFQRSAQAMKWKPKPVVELSHLKQN